jgi:ribonuclease HII
MNELLPYYNKDTIEVGCDEAGRGCLAGPVVAAAVVLNPKKPIIGLNDSKKTTVAKRKFLRNEIEKKALAYAVGIVSNEEIDEINILNASFLAMHRAIDALKDVIPQHLIIDGNRFTPYQHVPHTCIIKGDSKYQSIAAASILAKTSRDKIMSNLDKEYDQYDWKNNKGYPTKKHRKALQDFGKTPHHRNSFNLFGFDKQLDLFE